MTHLSTSFICECYCVFTYILFIAALSGSFWNSAIFRKIDIGVLKDFPLSVPTKAKICQNVQGRFMYILLAVNTSGTFESRNLLSAHDRTSFRHPCMLSIHWISWLFYLLKFLADRLPLLTSSGIKVLLSSKMTVDGIRYDAIVVRRILTFRLVLCCSLL